jgi:hypothetical protein
MSWVTVATFREPYTAHIARSYLEANDVPAVVAHEHHIGVNWLVSQALGGVKLQVEGERFEEARELLANPEGPAEPDDALESDTDPNSLCPSCDSPNILPLPQLERSTKAASLIVGIPFGFGRDWWMCRACGKRFRHRFPSRRLDQILLLGIALVVALLTWLVLLPFRLALGIGSFASTARAYLFGSFKCWECGAQLLDGAAQCPSCGVALPDAEAMRELVDPQRDYDGQCSHCHTPYASADYMATHALWSCSRCGAEVTPTP